MIFTMFFRKMFFKNKKPKVDATIYDVETRCVKGSYAEEFIRGLMHQYGKTAQEIHDDIEFISHPDAVVSFKVVTKFAGREN